MDQMKNDAIVCNIGHFDIEIDVASLNDDPSINKINVKPQVDQYIWDSGKRILLLAEGRLVNLAAAEGHPSEVMDMSFANQFLSLCRLAAEGKEMDTKVYDITLEQDMDLATTKLSTLGFSIDELTAEQIAYSTDYTAGT